MLSMDFVSQKWGEKILSKIHSYITNFLHSLVWLFFCLPSPTAASSAAVTSGGSKSMAELQFGEAVSQYSLCVGLAAQALPWAAEITWQEINPEDKLAV